MTYSRRQVGTFGEETLVPQDENLPTYTPSGTDVPHSGASTLISAPRSNQIGYQGCLNLCSTYYTYSVFKIHAKGVVAMVKLFSDSKDSDKIILKL